MKKIIPVEKKEYYPLAPMQFSMYFLQQVRPNDTSYNLPEVISIDEELNKEKVEASVKTLINRHEALRTSISFVNTNVVQKIHDKIDFKMDYYSLEQCNISENDLIEALIKPFDLTVPPLIRVVLIKRSKHKYLILFDRHHIISDDTAINILKREFLSVYFDKPLEKVKIQYKDFVHWQNRSLNGVMKMREKFWLDYLKGDPDLVDFGQNTAQFLKDNECDGIHFQMDETFTFEILKLVKKMNVTVYMLLLSAYNLSIYGLTRQKDILVGAPVTLRNNKEILSTVGNFLNTIVLRNIIDENDTFIDYINKLRINTLNALSNSDYPYELLKSKLNANSKNKRSIFFNVIFNFKNLYLPDELLQDSLGLERGNYSEDTIKKLDFDLNFNGHISSSRINISCRYRSRLFEKHVMESFVKDFQDLLKCFCVRPETKIAEYFK